MFRKHKHISNITAGHLVVAAIFFCVLFGQGAHLHDLDIHINSHFDVHVHLHAHESHDDTTQGDHNQEDNDHQHEVNTATDIIGTLTSSYQISPETPSYITFAEDGGTDVLGLSLQRSPLLYDLPPPRPVSNQYYLSSYSHRGPPIV